MNEQVKPSQPLDEVMLAMDVVDTLRYRSKLVERELGADLRDDELKNKLRKIYAAQGLEVDDHVLEEGVRALRDDRFSYQPPDENLQVKLARMYVSRGRWGKWVLAAAAVILTVCVVYYLQVVAPMKSLPKKLDSTYKELKLASNIKESKGRALADDLLYTAKNALKKGDEDQAEQVLGKMAELQAQLQTTYRLQIVSDPQKQSGLWRIPDANARAKNYYIIVEAVGPDGSPVTVPITNEETGKTEMVSTWGLRVEEDVFNAIAQDKKDDGIIQNRDIGIKRTGYLEPEYRILTSGAAITSW